MLETVNFWDAWITEEYTVTNSYILNDSQHLKH